MILCDVNILINAFRSGAEDPPRYKAWLEAVLNGPAAYGVAPQVLATGVPICTHRRIFSPPSSLNDAFDFCRVILGQPNATVMVPIERHWSLFESLCRDCESTGNIAQDAWFAALAIEYGCEWDTTDRDYARFKGLT